MIRIAREPEPEILASKKATWLEKFLSKRASNSQARPDSRQYAHSEIRGALRRMSHGKCFYCERKPAPDEPSHVDHHVEVTDDPSQAFSWDNLYLSCHGCNHAKRAKHTKVEDCLDPCAADVVPEDHLIFDDEVIRPRSDSSRGRATIRKYALDRLTLNYERARALRVLERARHEIEKRCAADGSRRLSATERELLLSFGQPERPFSLMLRTALRALDL